jgi:hypothetical protein
MLSLWQAMARQHGFAGLHVLGTLNHDNNAAGVARAMGGPDAVAGLLQFFPTALLSTRPGHWSITKGFMECAQPTHPNNCTCFLDQLGKRSWRSASCAGPRQRTAKARTACGSARLCCCQRQCMLSGTDTPRSAHGSPACTCTTRCSRGGWFL